MESLSSVHTIMGIVQDILAAVETANQNKSRCKKVAKRVRCIKDILESAAAHDGTTSTSAMDDVATRRLMDGLEDALGRALQVVRQCQRSGVVVGVVAGGRMADSLDEVEREINNCILDLTLANSLRIARLETLLVRQQHAMAAAASSTEDGISEKDDDKKGSAESVLTDNDNNSTATTAIGVPVVQEMVPSYGYCWSCRSYHSHCYYWRNHGCDCRDDSMSDAGAAFYHTQYSRYPPSMFSDDDPNSCFIM